METPRTDELPPLSSGELEELEQCESSIKKHLVPFYEVGTALLRIRESKLYRAEYLSFDDYCRHRWRISRFQAYRKIQAAEIFSNVLTMGDIPLPEAERQVRPLAGLHPAHARAVWVDAARIANGRRITGKIVIQALLKLAVPAEPNGEQFCRQSWQDQLEPLLKAAVRGIRQGNQDAVRDAVFKAWIRIDVSRNPPQAPS